jgi:hypothetical protein
MNCFRCEVSYSHFFENSILLFKFFDINSIQTIFFEIPYILADLLTQIFYGGIIMKTQKIFILGILLSCLLFFKFTGNIYAGSSGAMDLVGLLTGQLGVTESQATGGAGALFKMAKGSLSESDYGKVSESLPDIDTLIQSAPKVSDSTAGISGKIGGVTEGLGSLTKPVERVNKLAAVTDQFSQLGMDQSMVSQFIPIILNYANTKGGETVMNLLKGVWQ